MDSDFLNIPIKAARKDGSDIVSTAASRKDGSRSHRIKLDYEPLDEDKNPQKPRNDIRDIRSYK